HWGLEADGPLVSSVRRLEPGDVGVVIGAAALPVALFIAAHDAEVFLLDQDLGAIEGAESRAVTEQLAGRFQALVVTFGGWFPDVSPSVVVIDPAALATGGRGFTGNKAGAQAGAGVRVAGLALPVPRHCPASVIRCPANREPDPPVGGGLVGGAGHALRVTEHYDQSPPSSGRRAHR